jgi:hypothetical protein
MSIVTLCVCVYDLQSSICCCSRDKCNNNKYEVGVRDTTLQDTLLHTSTNDTDNATQTTKMRCVVKQVSISNGREIVAQQNGPTCETNKWCRTLTATSVDDAGNGWWSVIRQQIIYFSNCKGNR